MSASIISAIVLVLGLCAVLAVPVGIFNLKVYRAVRGTKCTGATAVEAFVPFVNILFARKLVYGQTFFKYLMWVCAALVIFRTAALVLINTMPVLTVFSSFGMVACIALYAVLYVANAASFASLLNCGAVTMLCCVVAAPVGYYMLSTQVLNYFRSVEDVVSGRFGN